MTAPVRPAKCRGGCGRWLTDPESLARGYGRVCAERHGIPTGTPPKSAARASPPPVLAAPAPSVPGQLAIEFPPAGGPVLCSDWIPGDPTLDRPIHTVPAGDLL